MKDLLASLRRGPLLFDGASGTMLSATPGVRFHAPEEFLLRLPQRVLEIHQQYVEAGAQVIHTSTFGANRIKLARVGLEAQAVEMNRTAARLACEAAGDAIPVVGSIGPTGELLTPLGELTFERARDAFTEQATALAECGADALVVETMSDLREARAAIEGVRAATKLPVICTMTFDNRLRTMMGVTPRQAVASLLELGADVVGANCGVGPEATLRAIQEMRQARPDALLAAKPNAGVPRLVGDRTIYDIGPEVFAEYVPKFVEAGVRLIGACCGSTPDYTRSMAARLAVLKGH